MSIKLFFLIFQCGGGTQRQWKANDFCLAKYWEDNKVSSFTFYILLSRSGSRIFSGKRRQQCVSSKNSVNLKNQIGCIWGEWPWHSLDPPLLSLLLKWHGLLSCFSGFIARYKRVLVVTKPFWTLMLSILVRRNVIIVTELVAGWSL